MENSFSQERAEGKTASKELHCNLTKEVPNLQKKMLGFS